MDGAAFGYFVRKLQNISNRFSNPDVSDVWSLAPGAGISRLTAAVHLVATFSQAQKIAGKVFESCRNSPPDCCSRGAYKIKNTP